MFKNAERDPLAIPSRAPRRASVGPTHRTAGPFGPGVSDKVTYDPFRGAPSHPGVDYDAAAQADHGPFGGPGRQPREKDPFHPEFKPGPTPPPGNPFQASLPREVRTILDREARAFMEREGTTDDRSELLYRARRHAGNLTSTWSRDASEKTVQAFCGRVAALIPSKPRTAAAQPVTHVADFDDSLLY